MEEKRLVNGEVVVDEEEEAVTDGIMSIGADGKIIEDDDDIVDCGDEDDEEEVPPEYLENNESNEESKTEDVIEVSFPEYYFSALAADTKIMCLDDNGEPIEKTVEEIYQSLQEKDEKDRVIKTYALGNYFSSSPEIKFTDVDFVGPEEDTELVKITLSNGVEFTCGTQTMVLMCNGTWAPIYDLDVDDVLYNIKFVVTNIDGENGENQLGSSISPTITRIVKKEIIDEFDTKIYGFISTYSNILLAKPLNDKEISFIAVQQ